MWILIASAALLISASSAFGEESCASHERLRGLVQLNSVLALWGASEHLAEADSVCEAVWGPWWETHDPDHLSRITSTAELQPRVEWLCETLDALPLAKRQDLLADLDAYSTAYQAIAVLGSLAGGETLATAVAYVPAVSDLFPRDPALRDKLGRDVGSSLASAEHTGLDRALARRLAGLSQEEQAEIMRDLWVEALRR